MEGGHARGWINAHGWINVLIKQSSHSPASTSATQIICRIRCHEEEDAGGEEEFGRIDNWPKFCWWHSGGVTGCAVSIRG